MDHFYGFDVFICYTREDDRESRYANALFVKLANEKPRLRCFLDIKGLNQDETLSEAIAGRLRESRFVVILAGSATGERPSVLNEARLAVQMKKRIMLVDRGIGWANSSSSLKQVVDPRSVMEPNPAVPSTIVIATLRNHVRRWQVDTLRRVGIATAFVTVSMLAMASFGLYLRQTKIAAAEAAARQEANKARKQADDALADAQHQRSNEGYIAAQRAINESEEMEALPLLLHALRIWPENRLVADRLYGLLTQRTFAIPVAGPASADAYQSFSRISGFGVSDDGNFRVVLNGIPNEFRGSVPGEHKMGLADLSKPDSGLDPFFSGTMSRDGRWFATRAVDGFGEQNWLAVMDLNTSKELRQKVPKEVSAIALLPSLGLVVAAGGPENRNEREVSKHPDGIDVYIWRFAGPEPKLVTQKLNIGTSSVRHIQPFPDERRLAFLYNMPSVKGEGIWLCELQTQNLTLESTQEKFATIPSYSDLSIDASGAVLAFSPPHSSGDKKTSLPAYAIQGTNLKQLQDVEWPMALQRSAGRGSEGQFWPGTDLFLFCGTDRLLLGKLRQEASGKLRIKAITTPMTWYLAGARDFFLGALVSEHTSVKGRDIEHSEYCIFDGKQGMALPEVVPQEAPTRFYGGSLLEGVTELARSTNPSIILSATVTTLGRDPSDPKELPDAFTFELALRRDARQAIPLKPDFKLEWSEDSSNVNARGAISNDGQYVAVAAHDKEGFSLMVWDTGNGKLLTVKQLPKTLELDDSASFGSIVGLCFGDDPSTLCLINEAGRILLWDWRRRAPFSDLLAPRAGWKADKNQLFDVSELQWTRGKLQFVMNTGQQKYRVTYKLGFPHTLPTITRLTQLVRAITGADADTNGYVVPVASVVENREQPISSDTVNRLRQEWADAKGDDEELTFCRWYLADRATRPVYPGAKQTVPELFEFFLHAGLYDEAEMLSFGDGKKIERVRAKNKQDK